MPHADAPASHSQGSPPCPAPRRNGYCLTQDCLIQYPPRTKSRTKANGSTKLETQLGDDRETAHRRLPPQLRSPHVEHRREKSHQRQKPGMLDVPPPLQHGTLSKVTWKGRLRWQPGQAMASSRSHSHGPALQPTAAPGRCLMFSKGKPLQWLCVRAGYKPKQPLIMLAGCK